MILIVYSVSAAWAVCLSILSDKMALRAGFRPADATRLSTLTLGEVEGQKKRKSKENMLLICTVYTASNCARMAYFRTVHNMLKYALDYKTCRKLLFDSYFGNPANVVAPYAESDRTVCGHCDNCLRAKLTAGVDGDDDGTSQKDSTASEYASKQEVVTKNVTMEAWKVCKIIKAADSLSSRITLPGAGDLCRGLSKSTFPTKNKDIKASLNLDEVCNGKITTINKDDMEILLLELLLQNYLKEEFVQTAYTINSYIVTGPQTIRLTRLREDQVESSGIKIELSTLTTVKGNKGKGKRKKNEEADGGEDENEVDTEINDAKEEKKVKTTRKRKTGRDVNDDSTSTVNEDKAKGRKKPNSNDADMLKKPASRKKKKSPEANSELVEHPIPKKRRKKSLADSDDDEDWEDFGLPATKANGKNKIRHEASSNTPDDLDLDSDAFNIPSDTAGFEMPDDTETEGEEGYPFVRDKFTKSRQSSGSARSRAGIAALNRAGGNGDQQVSIGSNGSRIIDLDSF